MRLDLHNHTVYSPDGFNRLDDYERAYREGKFDAIAITDHHTIAGALAMRQRASFPVIVGQEILAREGEIIGLYLEDEIPRGLGADETVALIHRQGGLVYIPHPFLRGVGHALRMETLLRLMDRVDVLETHNGGMPVDGPNRRAALLALEWRLVAGAGSDAHVPCEIGVAVVEVPGLTAPPSRGRELLEALRRGYVDARPAPSVAKRVAERARRVFGQRAPWNRRTAAELI